MSNSNLFQKRVREEIVNVEKNVYNRDVTVEDIEEVFHAYVLGDLKATFVVARNTAGRYYEASLNTKSNKLFIDVYKKDADFVSNL